MKRFALVALLLCLPSLALAQDVQLAVEGNIATVKIVKSLPFRVRAPEGGVLHQWTVPAGVKYIDKGDFIEVTESPKGDVPFSVRYATFTLDLSDPKAPRVIPKTVYGSTSIFVGDLAPAPPVPPGPGPGPTPDPPSPVTPGKRYVIVIEETGDAVLNRAAYFQDKALAARFKEKGHTWRVVDQNVVGVDGQAPADVKKFLDLAKGKQLPQVFITNEHGNAGLLIQANLPATPAELLAFLTKWGG